MLDTRMPPVSTRLRRPYTSARSEARPSARPEARPASASRPQAARGQTARGQAARQQAASEPIRRSLPSARTSRLARSEMRLMGLATGCTAVVCALLLLYLAAYAHVTQLGIAQAQARTHLRQNQIRSALLQAQRNALESPQRIEAAAAAQGMTQRGFAPVSYIPAQTAETQAGKEPDWEQESRSDTTENSGAAASRGH